MIISCDANRNCLIENINMKNYSPNGDEDILKKALNNIITHVIIKLF